MQRIEDHHLEWTGERDLAGKQFVERHAQTILIAGGLSLIALAAGLLGPR